MSSDYRPRGGSNSGGSSSNGPRRRRGGRNRSGGNHGPIGENRIHTNGTTPKTTKKEGPLAKFFSWITGKSKKTETKPNFARTTTPRGDFKERDRQPREPRAEQTERPPREERAPKPEPIPQEIVSPKLYVGNLAYEAAEHDLFDLFSKVGEVKNVEIAMDRHSNRSKGFGFVEMASLDTAKEAAAKLNRTDFMSRQIVVSGAKLDKRSISPREADANPDPTA